VNEDKHPSYAYEVGVLANSSNDGIRWRAIGDGSFVHDWRHVGSS
jgi:hypothetical protein